MFPDLVEYTKRLGRLGVEDSRARRDRTDHDARGSRPCYFIVERIHAAPEIRAPSVSGAGYVPAKTVFAQSAQ